MRDFHNFFNETTFVSEFLNSPIYNLKETLIVLKSLRDAGEITQDCFKKCFSHKVETRINKDNEKVHFKAYRAEKRAEKWHEEAELRAYYRAFNL